MWWNLQIWEVDDPAKADTASLLRRRRHTSMHLCSNGGSQGITCKRFRTDIYWRSYQSEWLERNITAKRAIVRCPLHRSASSHGGRIGGRRRDRSCHSPL